MMHRVAGELVTTVVLLSLLFVAGTTEQMFPMDYIVEIVPKIRLIFNSACVFLIHDDLQAESSLEHLQKELARRDVSTATVSYQKLKLSESSYLCRKTSPLYVVLSVHEQFRSFLIQLSKFTTISVATWLLFDAQEPLEVEEVYAEVNVPFNCEFLVAHSVNDTVLFTEIYRIDKTWPIRSFPFGNWSSSGALQWVNNDLYARRDSLHGYVVKAAYRYGLFSNTKDMLAAAARSGKGQMIYAAEVLELLEHFMNFTTEYHVPPDTSFGSVSPNGSWNGMIGLLVTGTVDVGIDAFIMTSSRKAYIDFMTPLMSTRSRLFIKKPDSVEHKWTDFLAPLSNSLWLAIACTMIVLAAFLSGTYSLERRFGLNLDGSPRYTFPESLYCIFGSFCQQGHNVTPISLACRIVYFTSYVVGVILLAAYSAALISYLTVQRIVLPFTTFQSLLDVGNYRFGVIAKSAQVNYFDVQGEYGDTVGFERYSNLLKLSNSVLFAWLTDKKLNNDLPFDKNNSSNPILLQVYQKLLLPYLDSLPRSELEGLHRICSEDRYTFMTPFDTPLSIHDLPCVMLEIPHASFPGSFAFPMVKRHRFLGIFSRYLEAMRRTGVLRRLRTKAWPRKPTDLRTPWSSVTLEEVLPIFHLLLAGIALSILILVGELTLHQSEQATPDIPWGTSPTGFRVHKIPR